MKGKLIAGLIVSAVIVIGAIFTVSSIDSTKPDVTNKVVASKVISSGNNQGQATLNNNVAESSNIETSNNGTNNQVKNSPPILGTANSPNESNLIKSNSGNTQHTPGPGAHVNNMNDGSPMPVISNSGETQSNNSGKIEIIKPNVNAAFGPNTIIVKNGTGKAISNSELSSVMRYWVSSGENGYMSNSATYALMWGPQWLAKVSNSELVTAFIEANGSQAFSKNISAQELENATIKLYAIVGSKPMPFTLTQATGYIKAMLAQSYPSETITKVVQIKGGYYVYTTPFNSKGNNNPFWVVNGYTGYAQS